jgi:hypothetical protein
MYGMNSAILKIIMEFEDSKFIFDKVLYYEIENDIVLGFQDSPEMRVKLDFTLNPRNYSEVKKKEVE